MGLIKQEWCNAAAYESVHALTSSSQGHFCHIRHIIYMIISNFTPTRAPEPIASIIRALFQNRAHRRLKVDRSDFSAPAKPPGDPTGDPPGLSLRKQPSQLSVQSLSEEQCAEAVLVGSGGAGAVGAAVKRKLIGRAAGRQRYAREQRELNRRYNHYLLNFLHKTNLLLVRDRIPPNLSVLETADEGHFLPNEDGTGYERKDFPHYSNVILPQHLPPEDRRVVFERQFQKVRPEERVFQLDDNCVLKLARVYQFVSSLFKRSILFGKARRGRGAGEESENHDFEAISEELGVHFRTAKLLYDLLNSFYDFEREMARGEDSKQRAYREINDSLQEILAPYRSAPCLHVPHREQYISLRELRQALTAKMLEEMQGKE